MVNDLEVTGLDQEYKEVDVRSVDHTIYMIKRAKFAMAMASFRVNVYSTEDDSGIIPLLEIIDSRGEALFMAFVIKNMYQDGIYLSSESSAKLLSIELGVSKTSMYRYIGSLLRKKFFIRIGVGKYQVNPRFISVSK